MQDDESWQMGEVFGDHGWNVIVRPTKPLVGKQKTTTVQPCQTTKQKGTCQNRPVRNFQEVCLLKYLINEINTLNAFKYKHHQGPSINIWHPQASTPNCEKQPCCFFGWAPASKQWNTWLTRARPQLSRLLWPKQSLLQAAGQRLRVVASPSFSNSSPRKMV